MPNDKETVTLKTPSGESVDIVVPRGMPPDQIKSMLMRKEPALFAPPRPGMPPAPQVDMKESSAPGLVRAATSTLPVAGGLGGALLGAPAFGAGAVAGGGLGAAGGEAAKLGIDKSIFDYQPPRGDRVKEGPQSAKELALDVGTAGALGGLSEIPASLAITAGNRVLSKIVASKSPKEVGDAMEALLKAKPAGFSGTALLQDVNTAMGKLSQSLGNTLKRATGAVDINLATQSTQAEAKAATSTVRGVAKKFNDILEAAKYNAGIKGNNATPQQLFYFMKQLRNPAYRGNPGPVSEVLGTLLKRAANEAGDTLRMLAPESATDLRALTNLHAAQSAITKFHPNALQSTAATVALHPRIAAAASPAVTAAALAGSQKGRKAIQDTAVEAIP